MFIFEEEVSRKPALNSNHTSSDVVRIVEELYFMPLIVVGHEKVGEYG